MDVGTGTLQQTAGSLLKFSACRGGLCSSDFVISTDIDGVLLGMAFLYVLLPSSCLLDVLFLVINVLFSSILGVQWCG